MPVNNKVLGIEDGSSEGNFDLEKSSSGLFWFPQKDGSRVYFVLAKDINQTEDNIASTSGIPQIGTLINGAPVRRLKCKEQQRVRHPSNGAAAILWTVQVETDSRIDPSQVNNDPTALRPKRRWYTEKEKERVEKDTQGELIQTTAEEPIVTEYPFAYIILEIERYEPYPTNPLKIFDNINHTNENTFYGAPPGTALMDDLQSDEEIVNETVYIKTRYVIKFKLVVHPFWDELCQDCNPATIGEECNANYDPLCLDCDVGCAAPGCVPCSIIPFLADTMRFVKLLNAGYLYRPTAGAKPTTFLDKHGHPQKVNLAEDGTILPLNGDPVFLPFERAPYADFGILNLEF